MNFAKKCREVSGVSGRDFVPCSQISIVYALLGILCVIQDAVGDGKAVCAVPFHGSGDGICISVPVKFYDLGIFAFAELHNLGIFHNEPPFRQFKDPFTL